MSRSYRKPYGTSVRYRSSKWDKQQANRGVRRRINHWIKENLQDESFDLVPHRLECHHNDPWGWAHDGRKRLEVPTARDWSNHMKAITGIGLYGMPDWYVRYHAEWPPRWYVEALRK